MLGKNLRRLVQHRWYKDAIIPPETRVDPSGFPEEEFPVYCPRCSYLLTGLAGSCCPECGREFDRGRLLVERYLLMRVPLSAAGRIGRTGACIGFGLIVLLVAIASFVTVLADPWLVFEYRNPLFLVQIIVCGLTLVCIAIVLLESRRHVLASKEQAAQVFAALDWTDPIFLRAQRLRWAGRVFQCIAFVVLIVLTIDDKPYSHAFPVLASIVFVANGVSWIKGRRRWGPRRNQRPDRSSLPDET
jgi:hypothetical protein